MSRASLVFLCLGFHVGFLSCLLNERFIIAKIRYDIFRKIILDYCKVRNNRVNLLRSRLFCHYAKFMLLLGQRLSCLSHLVCFVSYIKLRSLPSTLFMWKSLSSLELFFQTILIKPLKSLNVF